MTVHMRKLMVIAVAVGFFAARIAHAQGTIYLSNLGQVSNGSAPVASDSWLAADFRTGTNTGGYLLDSVQLAMTDASGNPSGFTAMLYSAIGGVAIFPGSSLGALNGSLNPVTSSVYTYTPTSSLALSPSTHFFIVLTAGTAVADGAYDWRVTDTASMGFDGWSANTSLCHSSDGSGWHFFSGTLAQFALTATPIPEPSASSLLLMGVGFFICVRRVFHR